MTRLLKNKIFKLVFTGFLLLTNNLPAISQVGNHSFRNLTSAEGLPGTSVAAVEQDSFGFIWIASWQGVYRYDGSKFKTIINRDCRWMAADDKGGVWLSFTGSGSVGYYNTYTDSITHYEIHDQDWSPWIAIDDAENVWVLTDMGIARYYPETDTFKVEYSGLTNIGFLSAWGEGNLVFIARSEPDSNFEIGYRNSSGKYTFEDFPRDKNNPLPEKDFIDSYPPFGIKPINGDSIFIVNKFGWATKKISDKDWIFRKPLNGQEINNFRAIIVDHQGNLWLNQLDAISKINIQSGTMLTYTHDPLNTKSILPLAQVGAGNDLYIDHQGILWITRFGYGISCLNLYENDFGLVKDETGKPLVDVLSALELPDSSYLIGVRTDNNKSLFHFNKYGNIVNKYGSTSFKAPVGRSVSDQLSHPFPWSLATTKDGSIWVGTGWPREEDGGLNKIAKGSDQILRFKSDPNDRHSLTGNWVVNLLLDGNERLWISSVKNEWCWIDPVTNEITRPDFFGDTSRLELDRWHNGFIDLNGDLIFEKKGKYFKVDHLSMEVSPFAQNMEFKERITFIVQDESNKIWFVSKNGFGYLGKQYNEVEYFYDFKNNNFPADNVRTLNVDTDGNVWLATDNGLVRFDTVNKKYIHFGYERGLQGNSFIGRINHKGPSGKIYFGGNAGINIIDPDKININPFPPDIVFTGFKLDGKQVEPGPESVLQNPMCVTEEIVVGPEISVISIDFAAIHFAGQNNQYQYKLDGFDNVWRDGGSIGSAIYTNLSNGKYIFRVKGSNQDGIWSDGSDFIEIRILPPWWKTWWAYGIYIILFALLIVLFDRWRKKRLLEKERTLAREKELAQSKEIEKAYDELKSTQQQLIHSEKMASLGELTAGIAHEIQNPLNFVNNFSEVNAELISEMKEEIGKGNFEELKALVEDLAVNEEKIIHHGKRADAIVKGMLQHSRTNAGQKEPTDLNALADEYLRLSYHGLRAKDKNFNADFKTDFDAELPKIEVIPQDIGRVLLNLINNAFYAVHERTLTGLYDRDNYKPTVKITTQKIDNKIEIHVKDNGNGIPEEIKDKIFQPFFTTKPTGEGTGLGLSLSYDIITKGHGGALTVESQAGKGTDFIIRLNI